MESCGEDALQMGEDEKRGRAQRWGGSEIGGDAQQEPRHTPERPATLFTMMALPPRVAAGQDQHPFSGPTNCSINCLTFKQRHYSGCKLAPLVHEICDRTTLGQVPRIFHLQ